MRDHLFEGGWQVISLAQVAAEAKPYGLIVESVVPGLARLRLDESRLAG